MKKLVFALCLTLTVVASAIGIFPGWNATVEEYTNAIQAYDGTNMPPQELLKCAYMVKYRNGEISNFSNVISAFTEASAQYGIFVDPNSVISVCYMTGEFIPNAYEFAVVNNCIGMQIQLLLKYRGKLAVSANDAYAVAFASLQRGYYEPAGQLYFNMLPQTSLPDAQIKSDLTKLNRKYSVMLLDDELRPTIEPLVIRIRTLLDTY